MIDRLIPKYPTFMMVGFLIAGASLLLFTAGRDALIVVWANKLFDGDIDTTFKVTQTADKVIGHTLTVLLFVGLSFIKLGIGFAIATIVGNLRATGQATLDTYSAAGVAEADASRFTEPWFGRYFTRFLVVGMSVVLFFFVVALWWDANLVFLKRAEFAGQTTGAAYETYLMIERILDPVIGAGKFVGEALLILGIAMGLATIIAHLSFQSGVLPALTRRAMGVRESGGEYEPVRPIVSHALVNLGISGAAVMTLALPLARIHRRTALGPALEEARGCSCESGIMVLEQKPARKQGAPNRCCHRTNPTVSASSLTTTAWWPMPG